MPDDNREPLRQRVRTWRRVGQDCAKLLARPWDSTAIIKRNIMPTVLEELRQIPRTTIGEELLGDIRAAARDHATQGIDSSI